MAIENLSYEECRKKRIEENNKRLEELNLTLLSQSLHRCSSPIKPSTPAKTVKPRSVEKRLVPVRRSPRKLKSPAPVYAELEVRRIAVPNRAYGVAKTRDFHDRVYASDEARADAIKRAEELHSKLETDYPLLLRPMLPSHVSGGFWLGLQSGFCKSSLPKQDGVLTLVDEEENEFPVVYLARKNGLSGGWKGFAVEHQLVDGDAVIFQVIKPSVLKVYIVRVNESLLPKNEVEDREDSAVKEATQLDREDQRVYIVRVNESLLPKNEVEDREDSAVKEATQLDGLTDQ